jgi:hypothetical protein
MSHIKLVVLIETNHDDFATRRESEGPFELMADVVRHEVLSRLADNHVNHGPIYDVNGRPSGTFDISEVIDR